MEPTWAIENGSLCDAIARVVPFVARDETRSILTGVHLLAGHGTLRLVAADGFRLATDTATARGLSADAMNVVVPATLLRQLGDRLSASGQTVLRVTSAQVTFEAGGTVLSATPMEGRYPDYRLIMPRTILATVQLERERALSVCGLLGLDHSYITFHLGRSDVVSLTNRKDGRTAQATLEGVAAAGTSHGSLDVTFNAQYLAEALNTMKASHVLLRTGGPRAATLLTEVGHDPDFQHVLMPAPLPP